MVLLAERIRNEECMGLGDDEFTSMLNGVEQNRKIRTGKCIGQFGRLLKYILKAVLLECGAGWLDCLLIGEREKYGDMVSIFNSLQKFEKASEKIELQSYRKTGRRKYFQDRKDK